MWKKNYPSPLPAQAIPQSPQSSSFKAPSAKTPVVSTGELTASEIPMARAYSELTLIDRRESASEDQPPTMSAAPPPPIPFISFSNPENESEVAEDEICFDDSTEGMEAGSPVFHNKVRDRLLKEFSSEVVSIKDRYGLAFPSESDYEWGILSEAVKEDLLQELWTKCVRVHLSCEGVADPFKASVISLPRVHRGDNPLTAVVQSPSATPTSLSKSVDNSSFSSRRMMSPMCLKYSFAGSPLLYPSSVASIQNPLPTFESHNAMHSVDSEGNEMVNDYTIIGEIGRGSFATVDLAESTKSKKLVAIKSLRRSLLKRIGRHGPNHLHRVMTEIAIMKKLHHKNVVQLFEVIDDQTSDKLFLVMQYIDKGPVVKMTEDGHCSKVSLHKAAKYLRQCATGLQYLHRHHVIHRDIKPDNILLDSSDNVYLSDFGVSACFDDRDKIKQTEGTPAFFSPETCRGEGQYHPQASDVWSLGVSFYTMIFGTVPFPANTFSAIIDKIQNESFPIPDQDSVDSRLIALLKGLLNKDPTRRMNLQELKNHPWIIEQAGESSEASLLGRTSSSCLAFADSSAGAGPVSVSAEDIKSALRRGDGGNLLILRPENSAAHKLAKLAWAKVIVLRYVRKIRTRVCQSSPEEPTLRTQPCSPNASAEPEPERGSSVDLGAEGSPLAYIRRQRKVASAMS